MKVTAIASYHTHHSKALVALQCKMEPLFMISTIYTRKLAANIDDSLTSSRTTDYVNIRNDHKYVLL